MLLQTLSQLLQDAYAQGSDWPEALFLVHDKETLPSAQGKELQATLPPISTAPSSDFYGATIASLVAYVQGNDGNEQVSSRYFLVVDEQTAKDMTVALVGCTAEAMGEDDEGELVMEVESVRLASSQANAPVVAMEVGCGSIPELRGDLAEDGVYRGGKAPATKQGEPAPRKLLG